MSGKNPLPREQAYQGVKAVNPPDVISSSRSPKSTDTAYALGTLWLNKTADSIYALVAAPGIWVQLAGAAGQILYQLTLEGPGTDDISLLVESGDVVLNTGNLLLDGPGSVIGVAGGTALDSIGEATLIAGSIFIANTNVIANSRVFLSRNIPGGTVGTLSYTVTPGAGFAITSSSASDTSTVAYFIVQEL